MIKIAINDKHRGKLPPNYDMLSPRERQHFWRTVNGRFTNARLESVKQLIQGIQYGWPYTTWHGRGWRSKQNFICGQHVALDFDGSDFNSILRSTFIAENASFLHTTASHTPDSPRSRAVFILPRPITSVEKYSLLTEAFSRHWGEADDACKDPVRLFFGAPDCEVHYLGNTLSFEAAAEIVLPYKKKLKKRPKLPPLRRNGAHSGLAMAILNRMQDEIMDAPDGNKYTTLVKVAYEAGGHVAGGTLEEAEAISALSTAIHQRHCRDYSHADQAIVASISDGMNYPIYPREQLDPITEALFRA